MERKGEVIPCSWTEDSKGVRTNSGESGARNLEVESMGSRVESMGGCVKLKTVAEVRQSSTHANIFSRYSVYLVLNSLLDWEPVERLKQE